MLRGGRGLTGRVACVHRLEWVRWVSAWEERWKRARQKHSEPTRRTDAPTPRTDIQNQGSSLSHPHVLSLLSDHNTNASSSDNVQTTSFPHIHRPVHPSQQAQRQWHSSHAQLAVPPQLTREQSRLLARPFSLRRRQLSVCDRPCARALSAGFACAQGSSSSRRGRDAQGTHTVCPRPLQQRAHTGTEEELAV